jgi:hypothetical protein
MLGGSGTSGKLKAAAKKDQSILKKRDLVAVPLFGGGSGATNGLASSVAMSHVKGMELLNPSNLQ